MIYIVYSIDVGRNTSGDLYYRRRFGCPRKAEIFFYDPYISYVYVNHRKQIEYLGIKIKYA